MMGFKEEGWKGSRHKISTPTPAASPSAIWLGLEGFSHFKEQPVKTKILLAGNHMLSSQLTS